MPEFIEINLQPRWLELELKPIDQKCICSLVLLNVLAGTKF